MNPVVEAFRHALRFVRPSSADRIPVLPGGVAFGDVASFLRHHSTTLVNALKETRVAGFKVHIVYADQTYQFVHVTDDGQVTQGSAFRFAATDANILIQCAENRVVVVKYAELQERNNELFVSQEEYARAIEKKYRKTRESVYSKFKEEIEEIDRTLANSGASHVDKSADATIVRPLSSSSSSSPDELQRRTVCVPSTKTLYVIMC